MRIRVCARSIWMSSICTTALLALLLAPIARSAEQNAEPLTGCDVDRPAVAHLAGGVTINSPEPAPIPCISAFGPSYEYVPVAAHPDGTVFAATLIDHAYDVPSPMDPANGRGNISARIARSTDRGGTWQEVKPPDGHIVSMGWMSVDPATSRLWYMSTLVGAAKISWSDDRGETWQDNAVCCLNTQGGAKVFEGPAPEGSPEPTGYDNLVYFCGNMSAREGPVLNCYKSLDGGMSFVPIGGYPDNFAELTNTECRSRTRSGVVGPDGTLYFPVQTCTPGIDLAVSDDEGATWRRIHVVDAPVANLAIVSLGVDRSSNLYLAWLGQDRLPYLTVSQDRGATWSTPMAVAAPGVTHTRNQMALAVGEVGEVAIAYLGSTDGGATFSGYLTQSRNVLDAPHRSRCPRSGASHSRPCRLPTFWSAAVNDPSMPLQLESSPQDITNREYYRTVAFGPDGTPWAGYHCVETPSCPEGRTGVVGYLEWPT